MTATTADLMPTQETKPDSIPVASCTEGSRAEVDAVWRLVAPRVGGFLRRMGCPSLEQQDILQDVAERLLASDIAFDDADDLLPWACTAGRNLYLDLLRRQRRHPTESIDLLEPQAATDDIATTVELRLALAAAVGAAAALSQEQQQLLHPGIGQPMNAANRQARRRLLARLRLATNGLLAVALVLVATSGAFTNHYRPAPRASAHRSLLQPSDGPLRLRMS